MSFVKTLPPYIVDKEVYLSSITPGREFLLKINGEHSVYQRCKVGNTPLVLECTETQPNKKLLIVNMVTGRIVHKHPSQRVVPVHSRTTVWMDKKEVRESE